ncbi:MAG: hypothetical protein ACTSU6_02560 [Candidatus Njordarchaeales archaeon]
MNIITSTIIGLTIISLFSTARADSVERKITKANSCRNGCSDLNREQEDCVIKKRCYPEIKRLLKKNKELQQEIDDLKYKLATAKAVSKLEQEIKKLNDNAERIIKKRKNSVSLLFGRVPSGLEITQSAGRYQAEPKTEADAGLMYQRDLGKRQKYRGSVGFTLRGSGYLGFGLNF